MRQSRIPHFEVHGLSRRRWRIDAIFADRQSAIEDAKRLLSSRHRLDGVRVLRVEEEEQGFLEWTVYFAARPRARRYWRRRARAMDLPALRAPPQQERPVFNPAPALTLAALVLACGLMIFFAPRPQEPQGVWVFDRPEAWQPHALRNPWTGEMSKPGERWGE